MTLSDRPDPAYAAARARVEALRLGLEASGAGPVRRIETHISWVLLTPTHAYKLKKPVRLPFADFSTLEARRRCCDEEVRLNRRLAPTLYLDVVEIRDGPRGPAFGGAGPLLDVAVRMRRFPDGALWSERLAAGALVDGDVDRLAARLAAFHRDAAVADVASGFGAPAVQARVTRRLIDALDARAAPADAGWPFLRGWLLGQLQVLAPRFEARLAAGRVREGHGDLHLANLVQIEAEPSAFDGIEFDPELRWIDVLDDIAFVVMDLLAHDRPRLAFRFLDAYLEAGGDHDGLPVLRFYLVGRALVRAQVAAIAERQGAVPRGPGADAYLALAVRLARAADPRLAITHGLPGSGKSFVALALVEAAGAIRVRSDVERKRLHGLAALQSSQGAVAGGIYDAASTERTYARLLALARIALEAGWPAIVDAAFLRASERAVFARLAAGLQVPFTILDCRAPLPLLRRRLVERRSRGADASEADVVVLERLAAAAEPLDAAERAAALVVDAAEPWSAESCAARWRAAGILALAQAPAGAAGPG